MHLKLNKNVTFQDSNLKEAKIADLQAQIPQRTEVAWWTLVSETFLAFLERSGQFLCSSEPRYGTASGGLAVGKEQSTNIYSKTVNAWLRGPQLPI